MSETMQPDLDQIFEILAPVDDDIEGLLAYAYFKRHKRAWSHNFLRARGRHPSEVEEIAFSESACVSDQISRYRQQAQNALVAYGAMCVGDAREDIAREAITARMERSAEVVEQSGSLDSQVKSSVISTLLTTAILVLLAAGVRLLGIDLLDVVDAVNAK
ncbi:hypothetical protein [Rubrimonas cliftonensis]|uniref:Uncharacterized protein n=1 Tax=Rubrimonas cliftonensis TaxID=89524 RepID=A0A1H3XQ58_9RHOB|nr:hypothetical protein [Rubrimonas cliftonensis]SEA00724.1 hypothetical protein SAMN05444370_102495 [Rubrimonas cliftonensis]